MVWDEAALVQERINAQTITEAQLMKLAVEGILSKGSRRQFSKLVKQLNVEVKPRKGLFGELTEAGKELWGEDGA